MSTDDELQKDRTDLAKLLFSFANPKGDWSLVEDGLGVQSYYRGADRILNSDWYKQKISEARGEGYQAAVERLAQIMGPES